MALSDFLPSLSNTFVFQYFIPFVVLFAIFWGLLEMLGRFKPKVNLVVSIGFSLLAAYTNPWVLTYIATLGAYMAVVLFGILFLFGIIRWGLGRGKDIYFESSSCERQYKHYAKDMEKIDNKLRSGGLNSSEQTALLKQRSDIENKMKLLRLKLTPP